MITSSRVKGQNGHLVLEFGLEKLDPVGRHIPVYQVISHQVITGEQGKKYCATLPAPFERHDSEFSRGVQIGKEIMTVLIYHVTKSTYYESLNVA